MRKKQVFQITIDTEGDNLWSAPREIKTENARFLPRFQSLCERYGFKPTYLVNWEMANSPVFRDFGRDVIARSTGEIGMHLHAWNSPPIVPLTADDFKFAPYLIEFPVNVMREKIKVMTFCLEDVFGLKMLTHRAGRWAFDEIYARLLAEFGYESDCSVTPHVSWRCDMGNPGGNGGSDYSDFPEQPFVIDLGESGGIFEICGDCYGLAAELANLVHQRLEFSDAAGGDRDGRAFACEAKGNCPADAAAGSGDQRGAPFQFSIVHEVTLSRRSGAALALRTRAEQLLGSRIAATDHSGKSLELRNPASRRGNRLR